MYDDNEGCGGCLTLLIVCAIVGWLSDNWQTILLVIGGIIAIAALIIGVRSYNDKSAERAAQAKAKAQKEAEERRKQEYATYTAYFTAVHGTSAESKLKAANAILYKLHDETDESKRIKILAFFDRYLPVMTEILEASKHGATDIDDSIRRFTDTVKAFSRSLYKADDVVDVNSAVLENMAIRDGFYDPYTVDLAVDAGTDDDTDDTKEEKPHEPVVYREIVTVPDDEDEEDEEDEDSEIQARLDDAILLDDYETIRDMIDCGEISEFDLDEDVLEKVEEYI